MRKSTLIKVAAQSILRNKLRTFLTMLGIVIGVAAVIVMVAVGYGAQANMGTLKESGDKADIEINGAQVDLSSKDDKFSLDASPDHLKIKVDSKNSRFENGVSISEIGMPSTRPSISASIHHSAPSETTL